MSAGWRGWVTAKLLFFGHFFLEFCLKSKLFDMTFPAFVRLVLSKFNNSFFLARLHEVHRAVGVRVTLSVKFLKLLYLDSH